MCKFCTYCRGRQNLPDNFYDNGIRNALISNLQPFELRTDKKALWENFLVSERIKFLQNNRIHAGQYFWRTKQQEEIDYIEEREGVSMPLHSRQVPVTRASFPERFLKPIQAGQREPSMLKITWSFFCLEVYDRLLVRLRAAQGVNKGTKDSISVPKLCRSFKEGTLCCQFSQSVRIHASYFFSSITE